MNQTTPRRGTHRRWIFAAALTALGVPLAASAATWTGGGTNQWTDGDNWGGTAPVAGDALAFDTANQLINTNNFTAGTQFNGISFLSTAGAFNVSGTAVNLAGGIDNASDLEQTIGLDLVLQGPTVFSISNNTTAGSLSSRLMLSGNISGIGGLTVSGTHSSGNQRVTLSGTNDFTGGTTVGASGSPVTLFVTAASALPGAVSVVDGSTLFLRPTTASQQFANNISLAGDGALAYAQPSWLSPKPGGGALMLGNKAEVTGTITLTANARISAGRTDTTLSDIEGTISGKITGGFDVTFGYVGERPGTLTLTNTDNDWTGDTYVTGGGASGSSGRKFNLRLDGDDILPYGVGFGDLYIASNLNTNLLTLGNRVTINGLNGSPNSAGITGGGEFILGHADANGDYTGLLTVGSLTKVGTGTQQLGGNTDAPNGTTVSGGTLVIDGGYLRTGPVTVDGGANLQLAGGTLRYTSATDYSGAFTFTSGKLEGSNWNGGLSGQSIGTGKTLSPGTAGTGSVGQAGSVTQAWVDGGTFQMEIKDADGAAGSGWDHLALTGALDLSGLPGGTFTVKLLSVDTAGAAAALGTFDDAGTYNWTFASFDSLTGTFDASRFTVDTTGFANTFSQEFNVVQDGNSLVLRYAAVPEPSGLAVLGLGAAMALRRRRRTAH